jgi:hypothetical protein
MAAVRNVPDVTGQEMSVSARHGGSRALLSTIKAAAKPLNEAYFAKLH